MNAVEIEQAITDLAEQPFDSATFPYAFLEAFGNKETTIKRLRAGASNKSDLGGVLQTNNIHILTCEAGQVASALKALKDSPATAKGKVKFILATDGADFEAEDLTSGETVACDFKDFSRPLRLNPGKADTGCGLLQGLATGMRRFVVSLGDKNHEDIQPNENYEHHHQPDWNLAWFGMRRHMQIRMHQFLHEKTVIRRCF